MRRFLLAFSAVLILPTAARAQSLKDQVENLFRFGGGCDAPICLSVDGAHGQHYNPAVRVGSANLIGLLTNLIGVSAANFPISAASSGAIWGRSPEGLPIRTQTSSGPVFGERAQTLGKGHFLFGANLSSFQFSTLRGLPLSDLVFSFQHEDEPPGGLGDPTFEADYIEVRTRLNLSTTAATAFFTYGLGRRIDVSIAVPFVRTSMSGTSVAQVISFVNPTPHFFGTAANPLTRVSTASSGSASGIGDIAARVKIGVPDIGRVSLAFLGDVRLPTGKEENFLGAGATSIRGLAIASSRFGDFSPHANLGFAKRGGEFQNSAVLATLGFDHLMAPWATLALDAITEWSVGSEKLTIPAPVVITVPQGGPLSTRTIDLTNIPDRRDHVFLASIGGKFSTPTGLTVLTNLLIPIRYGGLQPNVAWTVGLEKGF